MGKRNLNKEDQASIRMILQRLCEAEGKVQLFFQTFRGEFSLLAETPDRILVGISDVERGQWRLKPGVHLTLNLLDRGLPYEAVVEFQGHGRFHGAEACHLSLPRVLKALDTHRLADFTPDRGFPCPFSDQQNDIQDGLALAFGEDGLELAPSESVRTLSDLLRLHADSTVELRAAVGESLVLPMRVAYFGDRLWGLRLSDEADPIKVGRYRQWVIQARHQQEIRDRSRFKAGGLEAGHLGDHAPIARALSQPRLLVDKDPLILVIAEGAAFPERFAEGVGRKFGVVALDHGTGPLKPCLADFCAEGDDWGRFKLVLIHQRIRATTASEFCHRLVEKEQCPLPILIVGSEEDADLKRNRAIAAGAVDHLVVEPFHVLSVLRALDGTLALFS